VMSWQRIRIDDFSQTKVQPSHTLSRQSTKDDGGSQLLAI